MFNITDITIEGFWGEFTLSTKFKKDVNVIIGKNGTGKTTLMNILHAVLAVDVQSLNDFDFKSVELKLTHKENTKTKTIKLKKNDGNLSSRASVTYRISNEKFELTLYDFEDSFSPSYKRKYAHEARIIREKLSDIMNISTLSVYRIKKDHELDRRELYELNRRELYARKYNSPVDVILQSLIAKLISYQLELSNEARIIAHELQKEVLTSLLCTGEDDLSDSSTLIFNKEKEKQSLIKAYDQLGILDGSVKLAINKYVETFSNNFKSIANTSPKSDNSSSYFGPESKLKQIRKVVYLSLRAEKKVKKTFKQQEVFLDTLKSFIADKKFSLDKGEFKVERNGLLPIESLSSGEKQLIILFTEALLQKQSPFIFIADEPELSLHIEWQRKILPSIQKLNPNAQIIVATHSPEVAGKYSDRIINMEKILK